MNRTTRPPTAMAMPAGCSLMKPQTSPPVCPGSKAISCPSKIVGRAQRQLLRLNCNRSKLKLRVERPCREVLRIDWRRSLRAEIDASHVRVGRSIARPLHRAVEHERIDPLRGVVEQRQRRDELFPPRNGNRLLRLVPSEHDQIGELREGSLVPRGRPLRGRLLLRGDLIAYRPSIKAGAKAGLTTAAPRIVLSEVC